MSPADPLEAALREIAASGCQDTRGETRWPCACWPCRARRALEHLPGAPPGAEEGSHP